MEFGSKDPNGRFSNVKDRSEVHASDPNGPPNRMTGGNMPTFKTHLRIDHNLFFKVISGE